MSSLSFAFADAPRRRRSIRCVVKRATVVEIAYKDIRPGTVETCVVRSDGCGGKRSPSAQRTEVAQIKMNGKRLRCKNNANIKIIKHTERTSFSQFNLHFVERESPSCGRERSASQRVTNSTVATQHSQQRVLLLKESAVRDECASEEKEKTLTSQNKTK